MVLPRFLCAPNAEKQMGKQSKEWLFLTALDFLFEIYANFGTN